jgi:hypothetical protein
MIASSRWEKVEPSGKGERVYATSKQDYSRFSVAQQNPVSILAGGISF